jgi:cysteinyl-tRNA synthetase
LFSEKAIEEAAAGQETFYRFFKRYERITGIRFYDVEAAVSRQQRAVAATQNTAAQNTAAIAEVCDRFLSSMDDDFNTGGAIGDLFELVRLLNKCIDEGQLEDPQRNDESALARLHQGVAVLRELCLTLGLFVRPVTSSGGGENQELLDGVMQLIVHLRSESRKNKNFETADKIRDSLAELEISLEDRAGGTEWTIGSESQSAFDGLMQLLIELRSTAREQKNFATADKIRDALVELRIVLEDRSGGTDWSISTQ